MQCAQKSHVAGQGLQNGKDNVFAITTIITKGCGRWGEGRWQDSQGHACNKSSSIMLITHAGQSTRVAYPR